MTSIVAHVPLRRAFTSILKILLFFAAAVFISSLVLGAAPSTEVMTVLPAFCWIVAVYLVPVFVTPKPDIFSPVAWVGLRHAFDLTSVVAALVLSGRIDIGPLSVLGESERIRLALLVVQLHMVSQLSYFAGYYLPLGSRSFGNFPNLSARTIKLDRTILISLLTFAVFLVVYAQFQSRLGGTLLDITRLREGKAVWRDDVTMSWMLRGVQFGFLPAILLFLYAISKRSRVGLLMAAALFLFVAFLVSRVGQRGSAVLIGGALLMLFHYGWRRVPLPAFLGALMVATVTVNVLGDFRTSRQVDSTFEEEFAERATRPTDSLAEHADDRQRLTAQAAVMFYFPDRKDHLWGESWQPLIFLLIPRWVWPEKVSGTQWTDTRIIPELLGAPIPTPMNALFYANFSWLGMSILMYFWGVFQRHLYEWHIRSRDTLTAVMYVLILGCFTPNYLGLSATLQYVLPMFLCLLVVSVRRKQATPSVSVGVPVPGG